MQFENTEKGFLWRANATHGEPIRGILASVGRLPLGSVMVPSGREFSLNEGDPGRCFVYPGGYYPLRHRSRTNVEPSPGARPTWLAQFALLNDEDR